MSAAPHLGCNRFYGLEKVLVGETAVPKTWSWSHKEAGLRRLHRPAKVVSGPKPVSALVDHILQLGLLDGSYPLGEQSHLGPVNINTDNLNSPSSETGCHARAKLSQAADGDSL
jgi:hypothetical protein